MIKLPRLPELQPRERLLAVGSGVVVLLVLLDRLVLAPWVRHARVITGEIQQMEAALLSDERLLARKERIFTELARNQRYLRPAIADELQTAALIKEIEAVAEQSHLTRAEIKPLATEADELSKRYALDVRFECAPEEWIEFIYRLETSSALFEVERATLTKQEDVPDRLEGSLRIISAAVRTEMARADSHAEGDHAATR